MNFAIRHQESIRVKYNLGDYVVDKSLIIVTISNTAELNIHGNRRNAFAAVSANKFTQRVKVP